MSSESRISCCICSKASQFSGDGAPRRISLTSHGDGHGKTQLEEIFHPQHRMDQKELLRTEGQTPFSPSLLALEARRSSSSFHRTLQSSWRVVSGELEKESAKGALECVSALRQCMHGLREDGFVQEMTSKVTACAERNNLKMPLPPRTNRTPARLRDTEETEAINAAKGEYSGMREITAAQVPDQFNKSRLHMQLTLLGDLSKTKGLKTAQDVAGFIGALHPQTRELLTEVEKLIELCLCLPVSAASSECSFSTLRRLKTWLRSNMTQRRHLAVMHVHSDILDRMDIQH
ncbi:hypothetical protein F7725_020186 [Dissostichus mawsoni]|uniref:HAT C-terminal dimerisation domain-containing protein n=1 Tax=Dissostichus mawsoni TaxID=36200 RepID=A0A7J5YFU2_DISMA|nr:hypothetical protein F7725_020186 [Dissostichus mawsoni]